MDNHSEPRIRQFIEYAPFGSLSRVIDKQNERGKFLPEVFVWLLFRNLVRACLIMEAENLCQYVVFHSH